MRVKKKTISLLTEATFITIGGWGLNSFTRFKILLAVFIFFACFFESKFCELRAESATKASSTANSNLSSRQMYGASRTYFDREFSVFDEWTRARETSSKLFNSEDDNARNFPASSDGESRLFQIYDYAEVLSFSARSYGHLLALQKDLAEKTGIASVVLIPKYKLDADTSAKNANDISTRLAPNELLNRLLAQDFKHLASGTRVLCLIYQPNKNVLRPQVFEKKDETNFHLISNNLTLMAKLRSSVKRYVNINKETQVTNLSRTGKRGELLPIVSILEFFLNSLEKADLEDFNPNSAEKNVKYEVLGQPSKAKKAKDKLIYANNLKQKSANETKNNTVKTEQDSQKQNTMAIRSTIVKTWSDLRSDLQLHGFILQKFLAAKYVEYKVKVFDAKEPKKLVSLEEKWRQSLLKTGKELQKRLQQNFGGRLASLENKNLLLACICASMALLISVVALSAFYLDNFSQPFRKSAVFPTISTNRRLGADNGALMARMHYAAKFSQNIEIGGELGFRTPPLRPQAYRARFRETALDESRGKKSDTSKVNEL